MEDKMKKVWFLVFAIVIFNGGCAWMNPFSSDEKAVESADFEPNKFLWQAAKDKLDFMKIEKENKESGTMVTEWSKVENIQNEEFKIEVKVLCSELRSDCLKAVVYKRFWNGTSWEEQPENIRLNQKVEEAILEQARVLYRESLAINN